MSKLKHVKYTEMTAEEIAAFEEAQAAWESYERTRQMTMEDVSRILISRQINTLSVDDNTSLRMVEFYPEWEVEQDYTVGFKVQRSGKLFRCLQEHTSQDGWEPENSPSLWAKVLIPDETVIPEWEQPDSTNPYMTGDKVTHNGKTWASTIDNNVWEPSVYGWEETT